MSGDEHRPGDLQSSKWIVAKGVLFLFLALGACAGLVIQAPRIETVTLVAIAVWASCRFYYFLFYVLEKYVDPALKYRGLFDLLVTVLYRQR